MKIHNFDCTTNCPAACSVNAGLFEFYLAGKKNTLIKVKEKKNTSVKVKEKSVNL